MSDGGLRGAELARMFHTEVVAPLLARELPRLRYAAGRLGSGSDVLGLDDGTSRSSPGRRSAVQAAYLAWIGGA